MIGEIMGMLPPNSGRGEDSWVWSGESNGRFSIRSAYDLIVKPSNPNLDAHWDLVWKWKGPATDIAWEPGPPEWVVLNTDRSVLPQSESAAAGGLIRNEVGFCSSAFAVNLGKCSITRAELRGAIIGLEQAWEAGHQKVAVQTDSQVALDLLWSPSEPTHQHAEEIHTLRHLISRDWEVSFSHVYREGNHAADFLANIGHSLPFGFHLFPTSDCNLGFMLRQDCMGITEPIFIAHE
ncbi:Putative ribonuclease H protein At1g65750 [Linum perenne]